MAVVDSDGFLSIVDRLKDLVIVSGFNVYPAEVEGVLRGHPLVTDVAVVGERSVETGEAIVAFFVAHPELAQSIQANGRGVSDVANQGAAIDVILRDYCQERLARYKVPARFVAVESLPMGPTGKIVRTGLREQPETPVPVSSGEPE